MHSFSHWRNLCRFVCVCGDFRSLRVSAAIQSSAFVCAHFFSFRSLYNFNFNAIIFETAIIVCIFIFHTAAKRREKKINNKIERRQFIVVCILHALVATFFPRCPFLSLITRRSVSSMCIPHWPRSPSNSIETTKNSNTQTTPSHIHRRQYFILR